MSDEYWEIVEYECQDGKCLMIHNIPKDSKLGALSLDHRDIGEAIVEKLNEQQDTISKLEEEKNYWKSKAMTLLMQVCRLTPRMSAKEVIEFGKELEDE